MNFGDFLAGGTAGITDLLGLTHSTLNTPGRFLKNPKGNAFDFAEMLVDPNAYMGQTTRAFAEYAPKEIVGPTKAVLPVAGSIVGGIYGGPAGAAGGAAAGSRTADAITEAQGEKVDRYAGIARAGAAAGIAYLGASAMEGGGAGAEAAGGITSEAAPLTEAMVFPEVPSEGAFYTNVLNLASAALKGMGQKPVSQIPAPTVRRTVPATVEEPPPPPEKPSQLAGGLSKATESKGLLGLLEDEDDWLKKPVKEFE